MHCRWYPSMPCSRSPGGICCVGGACSQGGVAFYYGLLLWSSVMHFCYALLVWWPSDWRQPSGMVFWGEGAEGHNSGLMETPRRLLLRVVRILLECILVYKYILNMPLRNTSLLKRDYSPKIISDHQWIKYFKYKAIYQVLHFFFIW